MKTAKSLLSVTLALVFVASVVGCGGTTATTAPVVAKATNTVAAAVATEATVATEAPVAPPEPTVAANSYGTCDDPLVLLDGLTGADGAVFATLLENFAAANPDVCLQSEVYPWDTFFQKYPTSVAAGDPPDMVIFHASEVAQMASQGLMMPLDDVIYNDGTLAKADFNPSVIDAITIDGQTMAVPFDNHGWILWYNTKLISDAGLDPNNLPKNGTEFLAWAQKLTTDVNGKHPTEAGFDKDNVDVWAIDLTWPRFTIASTLWQFGADITNAEGTQATLDSPEAIAAVQYWHDLMYKYYVCPPVVPGRLGGNDLYKINRLAFVWEGTWSLGMYKDNPDLAAITKTAFLNSLAPDGHQAVKLDSHIMSIPTGVDADGVAKAKLLMAYLANNGEFWATSGQVPAKISVQLLPEVLAIPSSAMAGEQYNAIGRTGTPHIYYIEIQTAWETAVGNALASADANVAEALRAGNVIIQAILDRP